MKNYITLLFATALLGVKAQAPVANFTTPQFTICAGTCINYTDASTNTPTSWFWDFGDGTTSSIQNPITKCYNTAGTYSVTLVVANASGADIKVNQIIVNANTLPTLSILSSFGSIVCKDQNMPYYAIGTTPGSICQWYINMLPSGTSTTSPLSTSSSFGILWNNTGTYTLTVQENKDGCTGPLSDPHVLNVINYPSQLAISGPSKVFKGDTVTYSTNFINYTNYNWQSDNGTLISSNSLTQYFVTNYLGDDTITLSAANQCGSTQINKPILIVEGTKVYPGDANNDLVANNYDLLPIGMYYGDTGFARDSVSNLWIGHNCEDWGDTLFNGNNLNYVDCNGDGIINSVDTLAVYLNFNQIHSKKEQTLNTKAGAPELRLVSSANSYTAGETIDVELWLGDNTNTVAAIYGIAYDISFDATKIELGSAKITYPTTSFIGTLGSDAITFNKVDEINEKIYGAITRTNHSNSSGYGKIMYISFKAKNAISNIAELGLTIDNYQSVDSMGTEQVYSITTNVKNTIANNQITIYPNPFKENATISYTLTNNTNVSIQLYNSLGQTVQSIVKENQIIGIYNYLLNLDKSEGIYYLKMIFNNEQITRKVICLNSN